MKKGISILLVAVLLISMLPGTVFAAGALTVEFSSNFTSTMGVGDVIEVSARIPGNPGIAMIDLFITYDENVVAFKGFQSVNTTDFPGALGGTYEPNLTWSAVESSASENTIFVAKFEIVGGGDPKFAVDMENSFVSDENYDDFTTDYELDALENIWINAAVNVPIPEELADLGVLEITTDMGNVLAYEEQDYYNGVPYYIVTIPEGATIAYITDVNQAYMEDYLDGVVKGQAYAFHEGETQYISVPMEMVTVDGEEAPKLEILLVGDYESWGATFTANMIEDEDGYTQTIYGSEDIGFACYYALSFRYGEAATPPAEPGEPAECDHAGAEDDGNCETAVICPDCGEEVTAANTHSFTDYQYNSDATCAANGTMTAQCGNEGCTEKDTKEAPDTKLQHTDLSEEWLKDETGHWKACACGATVNFAEHSFGTDDVCDDCAYERGHVHQLTYVQAQDATCQAEGNIAHYTCSGCDALFADAEGQEAVETVKTPTVGHNYVDGKCEWCQKDQPTGYTFTTSGDVAVGSENKAIMTVKINGHSTNNTFNSYDFSMLFDCSMLQVEKIVPIDADTTEVKFDNTDGTIRIVGVGDPKALGEIVATITFTVLNKGTTEVEVTEARVSDQKAAVTTGAPLAEAAKTAGDTTADDTPGSTAINKAYDVTKPDFIDGAATVAPGGDYTFKFTDTDNYTYGEVTVEGECGQVADNGDGTYTIPGVNSDITIQVDRTANSYDVEKPENVEGADKATYGEDYAFTVTPDDGYKIGKVYVTIGEGEPEEISANAEGKYVIPGADITGKIVIEVELSNAETTIKFQGDITADELSDGLTVEHEANTPYTFILIPEEFYTYTFMVGETQLEGTENQYTIPANLVQAGEVVVTVTKAIDKTDFVVELNNYFNAKDGQTMWLVTATAGEHVMTYDSEAMFWSEEYNAYCWLVVSNEDAQRVYAAALEALSFDDAKQAVAVDYDCDINNTNGAVDVNDAQLVYDMYNAKYFNFDEVDMLKFLEADVKADKMLNTQDVTVVIAKILNG